MVVNITRRTQVKGVPEYGDEECIWTYEGSNKRIMGRGGGSCIMRSFMICTPHKYYSIKPKNKTKENETGGVCGKYGEDEKYKHGSSPKPQ